MFNDTHAKHDKIPVMTPTLEQSPSPDTLGKYSRSIASVNELFQKLYKTIFDKPIRFVPSSPEKITTISATSPEDFAFELSQYYSKKIVSKEAKSTQVLFVTQQNGKFITWFIATDKSVVQDGDWSEMNGVRVIDPKWLHIGRYTITDMDTATTLPSPSPDFVISNWCANQFEHDCKEIIPLDSH